MNASDSDGSKSPETDKAPSSKRTIKKNNADRNAKAKRCKVAALMIEGCWAECGVQDVWEIDFNLD